MDLKTFNKTLENAQTADRTLQDTLQLLAVSAMETYGQHGDTSRLAAIMNAGLRGTRTGALKKYLLAHVNVSMAHDNNIWTVKKKGKGAMAYNEPTVTWYEFSEDGVAKEKEAMKLYRSLISSINSAKEKGTLKTMTSAEEKILAQLTAAVNAA